MQLCEKLKALIEIMKTIFIYRFFEYALDSTPCTSNINLVPRTILLPWLKAGENGPGIG
jgi:hypothetical protein